MTSRRSPRHSRVATCSGCVGGIAYTQNQCETHGPKTRRPLRASAAAAATRTRNPIKDDPPRRPSRRRVNSWPGRPGGRRLAAASDTWAFEVLPSGSELWLPVHAVGIVHMGLLIGEIFDLEALAQDCVGDGVYEFFFSAPPLPFTGAVGSPINPLAVK